MSELTDPFVSDPRTSQPERQQGDRFTEARPKFLSVVPRTNFPEEIDLEPYDIDEIKRLARISLWTARHDLDWRQDHQPTREELDIRMNVFREDVNGVLRSRTERLEAEAKEEAEAF